MPRGLQNESHNPDFHRGTDRQFSPLRVHERTRLFLALFAHAAGCHHRGSLFSFATCSLLAETRLGSRSGYVQSFAALEFVRRASRGLVDVVAAQFEAALILQLEVPHQTLAHGNEPNVLMKRFPEGESDMPKVEIESASNKAHVQWGQTSDLGDNAVVAIAGDLRRLLADVFVLYLKTKNFHWHMSGVHFRDYHLLLDEHGDQLFAMTDEIAERARKLGGATLRSIGGITRHQRLGDNNEESIGPNAMLIELARDNQSLVRFLRLSHELCARHNDVATTSLIEVWIDQSERRVWFLREIVGEF
jgi:starvation-inducible DNA-binding protein